MKRFLYSTLDTSKLYAMILRNGGRPLLSSALRLVVVMVGKITPSWVRITSIQIGYLNHLAKTRGPKGLVKFLKASSVLLQQSVAGHISVDTMPLGARVGRTGTGIPTFIPAGHRKMIRQGNVLVIQYYLTMWSIYREIRFPAEAKISTITGPFRGDPNVFKDLNPYIPLFTHLMLPRSLNNPEACFRWIGSKFRPFPIAKSSPVTSVLPEEERSSTHPYAILLSAALLSWSRFNTAVWVFLSRYYSNISDRKDFKLYLPSPEPQPWYSRKGEKVKGQNPWDMFKGIYMMFNLSGDMRTPWASVRSANSGVEHFMGPHITEEWRADALVPDYIWSRARKRLGKVGQKEEAAGKMRIFAMVDPLTQWLLAPLHKFLFHLLGRVPMDGTFDQLKPLNRVPWGKPLYSLDLSAATDRLPIAIQYLLLFDIFKDHSFCEAWAELLVGRSYRYVDRKTGLAKDLDYAVGQPMGALSSWAMLAYTHHFIVQVAAWQSGVTKKGSLFRGYAVLGDDICIFERRVAVVYLKIIRALGVECNLSKSILSPKGIGIEFAKKTFYKGSNVSPTPWSEYAAALQSVGALIEYGKKYKLSFPRLVRIAGFGYRVLGGLNKPFRVLNSSVKMLKFSILLPTATSAEDLASHFNKLSFWIPSKDAIVYLAQWLLIETEKLRDTLKRIPDEIDSKLQTTLKDRGFYNSENPYVFRHTSKTLRYFEHSYHFIYDDYGRRARAHSESLLKLWSKMYDKIVFVRNRLYEWDHMGLDPFKHPISSEIIKVKFSDSPKLKGAYQSLDFFSSMGVSVAPPRVRRKFGPREEPNLLLTENPVDYQNLAPIGLITKDLFQVWGLFQRIVKDSTKYSSSGVTLVRDDGNKNLVSSKQWKMLKSFNQVTPVIWNPTSTASRESSLLFPLLLLKNIIPKYLIRRSRHLLLKKWRWVNLRNLGWIGRATVLFSVSPLIIIEMVTQMFFLALTISCILLVFQGTWWVFSLWSLLIGWIPYAYLSSIPPFAAQFNLILPVPQPWYTRLWNRVVYPFRWTWDFLDPVGVFHSAWSWGSWCLSGLVPASLKAYLVYGIYSLGRSVVFGEFFASWTAVLNNEWWADRPIWALVMTMFIHIMIVPFFDLCHLGLTGIHIGLSAALHRLIDWLFSWSFLRFILDVHIVIGQMINLVWTVAIGSLVHFMLGYPTIAGIWDFVFDHLHGSFDIIWDQWNATRPFVVGFFLRSGIATVFSGMILPLRWLLGGVGWLFRGLPGNQPGDPTTPGGPPYEELPFLGPLSDTQILRQIITNYLHSYDNTSLIPGPDIGIEELDSEVMEPGNPASLDDESRSEGSDDSDITVRDIRT